MSQTVFTSLLISLPLNASEPECTAGLRGRCSRISWFSQRTRDLVLVQLGLQTGPALPGRGRVLLPGHVLPTNRALGTLHDVLGESSA